MAANTRARLLILVVVYCWLANGVWRQITGQSIIPVSMPPLSSLNARLESMRFETLIEQVEPAVVTISCGSSIGSGFAFRSRNYILTNFHVITQRKPITLSLANGEARTAKIIGSDRASDIAVLQVQGNALPILAIGDSSQVKRGQTVFVVGSPLHLSGTVTNGIVSAVRKTRNQTLIQTNAAINPGSSGAPLFDQTGQVIGIIQTVAVRRFNLDSTSSNQRIPASGISMAIAMNDALKIANQLISKGEASQ